MRIALLSEFVYPFRKGGAEKRFYEVATRLVQRGHEVHWFGMQDWDGPTAFRYEGIHIHSATPSFEVYSESGRRRIPAALRLSAGLTRALGRARGAFDLLDLSLYPFFHIFGARLLRPRTKSVITWHEHWGPYWFDYVGKTAGSVGRAVEFAASRVPHHIIATSDLVQTSLVSSGVSPARVTTIHNGVDLEDVRQVKRTDREVDVVFFGRLKDHKNVDLLLRALAAARKDLPDIRCRIVGDGPERDRLVSLAANLSLGDSVEFLGALEREQDVLSVVKGSKVCVNPSTKEGGGSITLLEANACGVPVIAIRHPLGIDQGLIDDGSNGWWVDEMKASALASKIVAVLDDASGLARAHERSKAFAKRFDWAEIASQYESVYREVSLQ